MNPNKRQSIARVGDVQRTANQIRALLSIAESCEDLLAKEHDIGTTVEFDEASAKAASETYVLAHLQLRNIIDDQSRWALNETDGDRYVERLAEANLKVTEEQKRNLAELRRPSRVYGARVGKIEVEGQGLRWVAWINTPIPAPGQLHGLGMSAAEALDDFDRKFAEKLSELSRPKAEEPAPPAAPPAPARPRRRKST